MRKSPLVVYGAHQFSATRSYQLKTGGSPLLRSRHFFLDLNHDAILVSHRACINHRCCRKVKLTRKRVTGDDHNSFA